MGKPKQPKELSRDGWETNEIQMKMIIIIILFILII